MKQLSFSYLIHVNHSVNGQEITSFVPIDFSASSDIKAHELINEIRQGVTNAIGAGFHVINVCLLKCVEI